MKVPGIKYIQGRNSYSPSTKYGIAIHNTSNTASAANEASYATRRTDGTSSHFYTDRVETIQSLDTANRAGHAGSTQGNHNAVAVEITGTNDKSRQWWIDNVNWVQLGYVLAQVCKSTGTQVRRASVAEMKANPTVKAFYSHNDMRQAWGGTDHTDPGDSFPWDVLFAAVNSAMNPVSAATTAQDEEDEMSFANIQIGEDGTNVNIPGGKAWRDSWLVLTNDTSFGVYDGDDYALRIAAKPYNSEWVFINDTQRVGGTVVDGVVTVKNGETVSWKLPADTRDVSILRVPVEGATEVFAGPLSCAVERP